MVIKMNAISDYLADLATLRSEINMFGSVTRGDKARCLLMLDSLKNKCNRKMLWQYILNNKLSFMSKFELNEFRWSAMQLGYDVGIMYSNWIAPEQRRLSDIAFIKASQRHSQAALETDVRFK